MLNSLSAKTVIDPEPIHDVNGDYKGYKLVVSALAP